MLASLIAFTSGSDFAEEIYVMNPETNVAPEILSLSLSPSDINEGQSVTVSGTFSDPSLGMPGETFTGSAVWSDGVITPVVISGGSFSATRTFLDDHPATGTASDDFGVTVTINDDDGGSDSTSSGASLRDDFNDNLLDGWTIGAALGGGTVSASGGVVAFTGPPAGLTYAEIQKLVAVNGDFTTTADFRQLGQINSAWRVGIQLWFGSHWMSFQDTDAGPAWYVYNNSTSPVFASNVGGTAGVENLTQTLKVSRTGSVVSFSVIQGSVETPIYSIAGAPTTTLTRVDLAGWVHGSPLNSTVDNFVLTANSSGDVTVHNVAPEIESLNLSSADIAEGQSVTVSGSFTDPGLGAATETFSGSAVWSDGLSTPLTINADGTFSSSRSFADDNPSGTASDSFSVTITIRDDDLGSDSATSSTLTVHNVRPTLVLDPVVAIDENGVATLTGTITDPGTRDDFTLIVFWGDSSVQQFNFPPSATGSQTFSVTHQYLDDNPSGTPLDTLTIVANLTDDDTGTTSDSESVLVRNVRPTLVLDPVAAIDENGVATLTGTITDPGTWDDFTLIVFWGDSSVQQFNFPPSATGSQTFSVTHQYQDDNPNGTPQDTLTIVANLTDDDRGATSDSESVLVRNVRPTLVLDPVAAIDENGVATLTGTITDPGTRDDFTLIVFWGDSSVQQFNFPPSATGSQTFSVTHQYLDDNPSGTSQDTLTIVANLTDDDLSSDTDSASVTIHNVAPVITGAINGPSVAVPGQSLSYSIAGFTDVGTLDTHATAWQVTNSSHVVVASGSGLALDFTPTTPDTYTVTFTVTDDDTGSDTESRTLSVSFASMQTGACCSGNGVALVVGSLTVNDRIHVNPLGNDGTLQVTITDRTTNTVVYQQAFAPPAGGFGQIVIFGQGADDHIQIAGSITVGACVHAGAGNDDIKGGGGHDILLGESGADQIQGGGGRDLLIGGTGADRLVGNNEEDLLIAGTTAFDNNGAALCAILAEWTSNRGYAQRLHNLSHGTAGEGLDGTTFASRANAGYFLIGDDGATQTVFNDSDVDTLTGSSGADWFLANKSADNGGPLDKVTDQAVGELYTDMDW